MPSLWKKKNRGNRISRLVADLQTTPKRGGSLVVETGFPTSIIDLFVKNRDRLKKTSKKKLNFEKNNKVSDFYPSVLNSKLEIPSLLIDQNDQNIVAQMSDFDFCVEEIKIPLLELENREEIRVFLSLKSSIWLCVLFFVVVFVALCTKKFVLGMSVGAFLLLLLEVVGNSGFRVFRPCDYVLRRLCFLFGGMVGVGNEEKGKKVDREVVFESEIKQEIEQEGSGVDHANVGALVSERSSLDRVVRDESGCEIEEVVEPNGDFGHTNKLCGVKEGDGFELVDVDGKTKKGKKFWKRFVPKHISRKKKHTQCKENDQASCEHEVPIDCFVESTRESNVEGEQKTVGIEESLIPSSVNEVVELRGEECVSDDENHNSHFEMLQSDNKLDKSIRVNVKQGLNFKCLSVMGIALVGLINSRVFALILTMICCVVFKMIRR